MTGDETKVSQYLCPGCEEPVKRELGDIGDAAKRPWHNKCARDKLAKHFRTPLSPVEAVAAVEFEATGELFVAPHSFHLREIVFEDDVEISAIFVGNLSVVLTQQGQATIRSKDFGGRIVIDRDVHAAFGVMVICLKETEQGVNVLSKNFKWRLLGERRPESGRPKSSAKQVTAVGGLKSEAVVEPGEAVELSFVMPAEFYGQRLVCDDWRDWQVTAVRLGVDPGTLVLQDSPLPLEGASTILPTYTARVAERVVYRLQNFGKARKFIGRVYGTTTW